MFRSMSQHRMTLRAAAFHGLVWAVLFTWDLTSTGVVAQGAGAAEAAAQAGPSNPVADATNDKAAAEKAEAAPDGGDELSDGRLIRVRLPLTGNADAHIIRTIQRAAAQLKATARPEANRPVLILELSAKGGEAGYGEGTEFSRALALADYLVGPELVGVKTVAYLPKSIKGHGVLVALACEVIAMGPDAELGEAGIDEDS